MKRTTESRNRREGHYAGRSNWSREYGRHQGPLRHMRTGQDGHGSLRERIPPGGWYGDPLGGGWGDE
jgi:hypothetical protein